MIILKPFVWRKDHFAYHLTSSDYMKMICSQGLKPLCGERSQSVGDDTKGVFFFDCLESVLDWIDYLYKDRNVEELELLRFNLKNRKWVKQNDCEFYLPHKVLPERVEYLRIYDQETSSLSPLSSIGDYNKRKELIWKGLKDYKPFNEENGL